MKADHVALNCRLLAYNNGMVGYIDLIGRVRIPFIYDAGGDFDEGLANVSTGTRKMFIDSEGRVAFEHDFSSAGLLSEGLCSVVDEIGEQLLAGYISAAGKLCIPLQFDIAGHFSGGLAAINLKGRWGYINKNGEIVIPAEYDFCTTFLPGEAVTVFGIGGKYGLISNQGKILRKPTLKDLKGFRQGLIAVRVKNCWGFANQSGEIVIPPRFENTNYAFNEGCIGVCYKGKWGFIDLNGESISDFRFGLVGGFSEGFAVVWTGGRPVGDDLVDGKAGYIDRRGNVVIKPQFDYAYPFNRGVARIEVGNIDIEERMTGYINTSGEFIWEPTR